MKIIEVNRDSEDILIYAKANFKSNGDYKARTATEEGYKQFAEYFKNIKFCCRNLETHCEEVKYTDSSTFIEYHRQTRSFWIVGGIQMIACCPFCGKRLPKELGLEWIHLVEEQFGEKYLSPPKMYELPQEWLTDEWWVKRGL